MIVLNNYPPLCLIAWNRADNDLIEEQEALALYEANWRFIDLARALKKPFAMLLNE